MNQSELYRQLTKTILPFWLNQTDKVCGGFFGEVDKDLKQLKQAPKNTVMQSRYLWAFSAASQLIASKELKEASTHGFDFLKDYLWDETHGGVYWQVSHDGIVRTDKKVLYAQSFALYALSEYYKATKKEEALVLSKELFFLIETHAFRDSQRGYAEEFSRDWKEIPIHEVGLRNTELSYTTNTHLHLFEAYTLLYEIWPNPKLLQQLHFLMNLFQEKIIQKEGYCYQFFTENWFPLTQEISYGHDIETSWLLDKGQTVIQSTQMNPQIIALANYTLQHGLDNQGLLNDSTTDKTKVWWAQAEAMIGFYNAYQKTHQQKFLDAAAALWQAIQTYFLDTRESSEWLAYLSADNPDNQSPMHSSSISDNWKGPYHTVRMYLELIKRLEKTDDSN